MVNELPDPNKDGVDHIRIDLAAASRLGRLLPLLADVKVIHPTLGTFRTCQGLWEYLKVGKDIDAYKVAGGFEAKKLSMLYVHKWSKTFKEDIQAAMRSKIEDNIEIYVAFVNSELPFRFYHMLRNKKVIEPKETRWLADWLTEVRAEYKAKVDSVV